jgi:spore coat protein JB
LDRNQLEILNSLQAYEFTAFDLNLYLDTHPNDLRALTDYSNAMRETKHLMNAYNRCYGPLMAEDNVDQTSWRWVEDPWPWDLDY